MYYSLRLSTEPSQLQIGFTLATAIILIFSLVGAKIYFKHKAEYYEYLYPNIQNFSILIKNLGTDI